MFLIIRSLSLLRIYQVRGHLRTSPKIAVKLEGSLYHRPSGNNNGHGTPGGSQHQAASSSASTANILHPACVLNGSFISQTFQILYRNEDVPLFDMAQFRLHVLVDSHKVPSSLSPSLAPLTSFCPSLLLIFFFFLLSSSVTLSLSLLAFVAGCNDDNAKAPFFLIHSTFSPLTSFDFLYFMFIIYFLFFSLSLCFAVDADGDYGVFLFSLFCRPV